METFADTREAKEYLIGKIVAEAQRKNVPLSDVERKMLYFTETAWMPDDTWDASAEFDRDFDQDEYEQCIGQLTTSLRQSPDYDASRWNAAVRLLSAEDHYLQILINPSKYWTGTHEDLTHWKVKFTLKAVGVGLVIFLVILLVHVFFVFFPQ